MTVRLLVAVMLIVASMRVGGLPSEVSAAALSLDVRLVEAPLYQGETANLSLTVTNTGVNEVELYSISVHPDWMPRAFFYRVDLSSQHVSLGQGGSFSAIVTFMVPNDLPPGPYYCAPRVQFKERDSSGQTGPLQSWTSQNLTISIHDAYGKLFGQLAPSLLDRISSAKEQRLESPNALTLLARAESEYELAAGSAEVADYRGAVAHLEAASALLDEAMEVEESHWHEQASDVISRVEEKLASLEQTESPEARRLASQAGSALSDARDLLQSRDYRATISRAEEAEALVEQALLLESEYQRSKTHLYVVGGSVVTAIACVAFALTFSVWRRGTARR